MIDNNQYFATLEENDPRYLDALIDKVNIYRNYCDTTGKTARWKRTLQNYFGVSTDAQKSSNMVTRSGDSGQFVMAKVNDYRNLIQHQLILVTSQRPAGEAKAINSDPISLKQARIGSSLVEYYLSQVGWEQKFTRCAETALVADESFLVLDWDATSGDPIRPKADAEGNLTGQMEMTGDLSLRVVSPWDMARDPYLGSPDDIKWGIYSFKVNKYDLASKYPNQAESILNNGNSSIREIVFNKLNEKDTDQIEVFALSHDKTPSVPRGRLTLFTSDVILQDVLELPFTEFNIYRMSQNDTIDSSFGYTNNNDLLALEEVTDALHSIAISNNTTFGAQAIIGPKGANLDHTQLSKGFAYFEVDPAMVDKVRPLQLTKTSPETFEYLEALSRKKETIAGINSVVRGDPEGALRSNSGSALALVQAQSLQFQSGGQKSYYQLLSKCCTGMILMLQRYANNERIIRITGKVQGQFLEEFKYSGKELEKISAVTFEMTNPLEKTIGGKEALAKDLLQGNMIKNPRQYLTIARTGSLDAFTEDDEIDQLATKSENQRLRDGLPVSVLPVENHEEHIASHMSVIAMPESKDDGALVEATLNHIQDHANQWQTLSETNPALLIATKQKVLPPRPPAGAQVDTPGSQGGLSQDPNKMMDPQSPGDREAQGVKPPNMPKMPINPMTGERAPGPQPQQ